MNFTPRTRVAVVTGPGPQITGTVVRNDESGIAVRLDSGEAVLGWGGDFYELTDDLGRVQVESDPPPHRPAIGLVQFAKQIDPHFRGFYTWGPAFLADVDGGEQHAADTEPDLPPLPRPKDPPQLPPTWPAVDGLAELHTDTVALVEASRANRAALEQAAAEARRVSTVTSLRAVA